MSLEIALSQVEGNVGLLKRHASRCAIHDAVVRRVFLSNLIGLGWGKIASIAKFVIKLVWSTVIHVVVECPVVQKVVLVSFFFEIGHTEVCFALEDAWLDQLYLFSGVLAYFSVVATDVLVSGAHDVEHADDAKHRGRADQAFVVALLLSFVTALFF